MLINKYVLNIQCSWESTSSTLRLRKGADMLHLPTDNVKYECSLCLSGASNAKTCINPSIDSILPHWLQLLVESSRKSLARSDHNTHAHSGVPKASKRVERPLRTSQPQTSQRSPPHQLEWYVPPSKGVGNEPRGRDLLLRTTEVLLHEVEREFGRRLR